MAINYKNTIVEWMKLNEIAIFQHHHAYTFKANLIGTRLKVNQSQYI